MLLKFLKRATPVRSAPVIPTGQRVYAIGDVHGRLDLLDRLLDTIEADDAGRSAAQTTYIFLGDLVDRGPDSAGVVERIRHLALAKSDVRLLSGNHEEIFLGAIGGDDKALRLFCRIGGRETAISYGIAAADYDVMDYAELAAALQRVVPEDHRLFLAAAADIEVIGGYAFVHAGVHPDRPLSEQRPSDLRWIRNPFLDHRNPLEKMIVHGHTVSPAIEFRPHRIGVDTGAYQSGRLSALGLEGDRSWHCDTL
ncbi:metallophosphoesterase family protein [Sphingomonas sp. Leaf343]|uniref:metallophosphoesterase family protein n=1 Tax=Sphingomonas sp. Leaf343 TaxID=1736345 RepID=UPI0006FDEA0E|nr:serine/threonine protein phosphatase [Sphingomonas sp. Leaf343]